MRRKLKRLGFFAIIFILASFLGVVVFEFLGQVFLFKNLLYFANDVDHRMKPKGAPDVNSDGICSLFESTHFKKEDLNVIFLGDSFIYGYGLPYDKSIPRQFEDNARSLHPEKRINAANFAWMSSSPLLSYRLLKDIGPKYNPDIVILAIDMTDFQDDIKHLRLLERKGIYRLVRIMPVTILALRRAISKVEALDSLHTSVFGFPSRRFFITERPLEETLPHFSDIRKNIEDISRYCAKELRATFILVILPRSYQYSTKESPNSWEKDYYEALGPYVHEPFKYFESIRDEVDYPIHSLLPDFQSTTVFPTCFDSDPHWNKDGARVAAEAIYKHCLEDGCFN